MRRLIAPAAGFVVACTAIEPLAGETPSHAAPPVSAGAMLYLDQSAWSQAEGARKLTIAADFMRVFCGDPGMPAIELVDCLDRGEGTDPDPLFERALSCVAKRRR